MHQSEIVRRRERWLQVYHHEISRRAQIAKEKPNAFKKVFAGNPKRLSTCCEGEHCWVPATTLWIHDSSGRGSKIDGFRRRGFSEAAPYKANGYIIIPQMCWNCVKTREKLLQDMTWQERKQTLADHIKKEAKGKPRGRPGRDIMLEDFDDLFV